MSMLNLLALSLTEIFGDFQLKFFARSHKLGNLFGGLLGYTGVIFFLIRSLTQGNVMFVNAMWDGMSGVIESVAAYLILGERMDKWYQYLGIVFVAFGLVLMKYDRKIPY
jgi:multidrug transporter EmrE-like cation transporter